MKRFLIDWLSLVGFMVGVSAFLATVAFAAMTWGPVFVAPVVVLVIATSGATVIHLNR